MDPKTKQQVVKDIANGKKPAELAKKHGVALTTIYRAVRKGPVQKRSAPMTQTIKVPTRRLALLVHQHMQELRDELRDCEAALEALEHR
jgi:transposase-like protein